ncbi:uncharacterized protein LOC112269887 [Brachypodium distachyon]|uniref:Uncharacterized protein n=1 Tax=Brachypodium distachyon TaxID=15368 RepID=A0A2K2DS57_BRADI|nr:uncharacterized protein LOC112269887 [Brachypodium distachyon]PNT77110.1 hypothetical protein BRADI_1g57890v3 [Brachypodium distachyon]|eukprot:XP_024313118.1 uncharacterized protein LOC112269887 [Brachypodium distachyon]
MACICACIGKRLDALVEAQRERLERRRRACLTRLWKRVCDALASSATYRGLWCQQLCFDSGLCLCCTCLCHPFHCVWSLVERRYVDGAKHVATFACHCLQFWTPLSVTVFLVWFLYRPDRFHPRMDGGVLARLDVLGDADNGSRMIRYDMSVDISFRNSHRRLGIRYLDVGAAAFYNGTKLGPADNYFPTSFRQGPKNTTVLHPVFRGVVAVDSSVVAELERERAAGMVHVRVTLDLM